MITIMKKITIQMNDVKNAIATAMLFFCSVQLSAQAPVITTNALGGNDYTFNVASPGNLKLALETLKTTINFTANQKDNFVINGVLNTDDITCFKGSGSWSAGSWSLNKLDLSGATSNLQDEQFDGVKASSVKEIVLPNSLSTLPYKTFAGCTSKTSGVGVTSIGSNCYSWSRWTTLGTFDAKNQFPALTTLQNNAFAYNDGDSDFTAITLPTSFTTFGNDVFAQCPKLASVILYATTPPALGSFGNRDAMNWNGTEYVTVPAAPITLYVPDVAVDTYKSISGYATYFGVGNIKKISDFATSVNMTAANDVQLISRRGKIVSLNSTSPLAVQVFTLSGSLVASETIYSESSFTLSKGCYILKSAGRSIKIII